MRSARRETRPHYPESWEAIPNGRRLLTSINQHCDELSARMFGYHLIKLGGLSSSLKLKQCLIRHQTSLGHYPDKCLVQSPTNVLPLQENSVDGFVISLELDFASDPHQILREVDRSLTANGSILLCGMNPYSLSGAIRYLPLYRKHPFKEARFFTAGRMKDWLQLLHYDIVEERYIHHESAFSRWRFPYGKQVQPFVAKYLPWSGSVYCLLAKKRTIPMTVAKRKWRVAKPQLVPAQAGTRVISPAARVVPQREAQE